MAHARDRSEITPDILLRAYSVGLFPMAESADDPSLFWVDPEERGIFPLDRLIVSRSLAKTVRSDRFEIRVDTAYEAVLDGCAAAAPGRDGTWINARIRTLYRALFDQGQVHTIEVWSENGLVGGLYGVAIGAAFFGESMFHRERDASKVALVHLVARLRLGRFRLLDTQFVTDHLATLGAIAIPKEAYHLLLADAVARPADFWAWPKGEAISGVRALEAL
ncbi:leucyl/phenylalanyl-tRNA--protein transferase [Beijerinckia sp. L45]|uniref:leucyl/phenylalanyl-tRNA--protein transferase n=1 Tax=Beijerinckia sp. L45 TaxID=1641855 RepID=UPI00131C7C6A|nr:leucyl/phenylalanyl-tRNA--protein transferase [Beijerinckia sp. L45]